MAPRKSSAANRPLPVLSAPLNTYGFTLIPGKPQLAYDMAAFARRKPITTGAPTRMKLFQRIADQFQRYNDQNEPVTISKVKEADAFKASYERETPGARELHNFLTGEEAADSRRRASRQQDGGGKKAARTKTGANGGGA